MSAPQSDLAGVIITASVAILVAVITAVAGRLFVNDSPATEKWQHTAY
jgi:hypothetical protein